VILLNPRVPDHGWDAHEQVRLAAPGVPVIFITDDRTAHAAIRAMQQGAFDCLFKPIEANQLSRVLGEAVQVARQARTSVPTPAPPAPEPDGALCGRSSVMREVYKSIGRVAAQDVNVLITGASGTGKELVARAIYEHSARASAPFLALNCAAIPENLLESELFGHEKGAFSGADRRRIGKFEQYDGGTILLDEIGDMPLALQAKILRLLQEQTFERVGGNETIRTNVRLLASTHRDLKARAAQQTFRADLYYRLSVFTIHLPPLRDRREDLPMLARHFLGHYSAEMGRQTKEIAPETLEILQRHPWPGNIRELQSVLKQALLRASGPVLLPAFLPELENEASNATASSPNGREMGLDACIRKHLAVPTSDLYTKVHAELDRFLLSQVLDYVGGNQRKAARLLGIARQTLRLKLRELGLSVSHTVEADEEKDEPWLYAARAATGAHRRPVPAWHEPGTSATAQTGQALAERKQRN
jgi:two-component system nitrogen regulation response regulator GlnG